MKVICAMIKWKKYGDKEFSSVCGKDHKECYTELRTKANIDLLKNSEGYEIIEGFLLDANQFVNRYRAMDEAIDSNQVLDRYKNKQYPRLYAFMLKQDYDKLGD